ncbi:MAG: VIT1/CCC1 transporter family protein [Bacteroidota bacterium]|nr:VIT1/CCC1 transporter family protein [Bacteroidota bacterium]
MPQEISENLKSQLLVFQKNELTEYEIYSRLAKVTREKANRDLLLKIAHEELGHGHLWEGYTQRQMKANKIKIWFYYWTARILGLTFGIKLMEKGESNAQLRYKQISGYIPAVQKIIEDEEIHENELIALIEEKKLNYVGSIVLGLNDALVELTGTLAGLSFALQNSRLIGLAGLITGVAAALSMASSEYLSTKAEGNEEHAVTSSVYTGIAYIITVILLVIPYFLIDNYLMCLVVTMIIALIIILIFNYYISIAKDFSFKKRFLEMAAISLGVALLSFGIGFFIKKFIGVNI